MSEQKKLTGIQRLILCMACGAFEGAVEGYEALTKEQKEAWHKQTAKKMFDRAMQGKLKVPYDQYEIDFIKEGLGIKDASK